ncbi:hypothetical protein ES332_A08G233900v1 [Gossypium tomentosum]|uniref:Uncharacterized protein n=1 Tax=Gossypium tomentosum TaxID=34277 RepID=A0A5D2PMQ6_GOSTO|nr:hypothetical protein ES332_A08G233900v1 [Gossypium tomentosum]
MYSYIYLNFMGYSSIKGIFVCLALCSGKVTIRNTPKTLTCRSMVILMNQISFCSGNGYFFMEKRLCLNIIWKGATFPYWTDEPTILVFIRKRFKV